MFPLLALPAPLLSLAALAMVAPKGLPVAACMLLAQFFLWFYNGPINTILANSTDAGLRAAWDDAAEGLIDAHRLGTMLRRIKGQILHKPLDTVSPLSVPILLDIGRESVYGEGHDALLAEAANALIDEAMRLV